VSDLRGLYDALAKFPAEVTQKERTLGESSPYIIAAKYAYSDNYEDYQKRYDRVQPYIAARDVEMKRFAARRLKFKELMLDYIKTSNVPQTSVVVSGKFLYYVDGAILKEGHLRIDAHVVLYPSESATSLNTPITVHASYNGVSLGQVATTVERGETTTRKGVNLSCTHLIDAEDAGLPSSGVVELTLDSQGVHQKLSVNFNETDAVRAKPGSEMVLHCRREGNHLLLPVRISEDESHTTFACLVDTGASVTTIARTPFLAQNTQRETFSTANGTVSMPVSVLHITVGDVQRELSVAFSGEGGVSLLGANFFEAFVYTVDLENSAIYLIKR